MLTHVFWNTIVKEALSLVEAFSLSLKVALHETISIVNGDPTEISSPLFLFSGMVKFHASEN